MSETPSDELIYFPAWVAGRTGYAARISERFKEFHREKHMRMTRQKELILKMLLKTNHHVGEQEIYKALKTSGIGRVTVFRALKMLDEAGLVNKVTARNGEAKYEINYERPHHDHLICVVCGAIQEIRWPNVEKIQEKACLGVGFTPLYHRHEIYGRCKTCAHIPSEKGEL